MKEDTSRKPRWPRWSSDFAWVREPEPEESWRLATWWIGQATPQLLFGWAFAWPGPGQGPGWSRPHEVASKPGVHRLILCTRFDRIDPLLGALAEGLSLGAACERAGLDPPEALFASAGLGGVHLGRNPVKTRERPPFVEVPWRLLPSRDSLANTLSSPVGDMPALRAALNRVDKTAILPETDEVVSEVLRSLESETGLDFISGRRIDLPRLGDLEVLLFPGDSTRRKDYMTVDAGRDTIVVRAADGCAPPRRGALVRCRQAHAKAILADELRHITITEEGGFTVDFKSSPVGPSGAEIEVWIESGGESPGDYRLAYVHTARWIRSVHMTMGLLGTSAQIDARWLAEWSERRRNTRERQARADAIRSVRHVAHEALSVIGEPDELWQESTQQVVTLGERLRPRTSQGLWVPQWQRSDDGKLRICEWFRATFARSDPGKVILVDPHFEDIGLDFIARVETRSLAFAVVTAIKRGADKATRLKRAYAAYKPLLERTKLSLFAVTPDQLHDRLILELDSADVPRRGFHLSNSLQKATNEHGFLITPIPAELLDDVAMAAAEMIEGAEEIDIADAAEAPKPSEEHTRATEDEVAEARRRVLAARASEFSEAWKTYVSRLADHVSWWGEAAADDAPEFVKHGAFEQNLAEFVRTAPLQAEPRTDTSERIGLAQASLRPFAEHRNGVRWWRYWRETLSGEWAFEYALRILAFAAPRRFVESFEDACSPDRERDDATRGHRLRSFFDILWDLRHHRIDGSDTALELLAQHGLGSRRDYIRYMFGSLLGTKLFPETRDDVGTWELPRVEGVLAHLEDRRERIMLLSDWLSEVPKQPERGTGEEAPANASARKAILGWMIDAWPSDADGAFLADVLRRADRGEPGASAFLLVNELLVPLHARAKLHAAHLAGVWLDLFESRLCAMLAENHSFYAPRDIPLTDVCAYMFGPPLDGRPVIADEDGTGDVFVLRPEERDEYVERIQRSLAQMQKSFNAARYTLERPFVDWLNYAAWDGARRVTAWLATLASLVELRAPAPAPVREVITRWREALVDLRPGDAQDPSNFFIWVKKVQETLAKQNSSIVEVSHDN